MAEPEMFGGEFRRKLTLFKYTRWAADLTQEQLQSVLWAIGELGYRSHIILKCLDRHEDELSGGYWRARFGLQVLSRMAHRERLTSNDVVQMFEAARIEMEQRLGKGQATEPGASPDRGGS